MRKKRSRRTEEAYKNENTRTVTKRFNDYYSLTGQSV
jgi:hypothetical protein